MEEWCEKLGVTATEEERMAMLQQVKAADPKRMKHVEAIVLSMTQEERKKGQAWGMKTIESFHTHGTPVVKTDD